MSNLPTLLLADDSVSIQRVVALTFADQPVRLVVAKDGQDAINRMAIDRPDLVLADTNMPCVDGYEVARWVRQQPHLRHVPVLLLAGVTDPVDEQRLHDSGANGVLEKPFEPSHVISRVKELLGIKGTPPAAGARLVTPPEPPPIRPAPAADDETSVGTPVDLLAGIAPAEHAAEDLETPPVGPYQGIAAFEQTDEAVDDRDQQLPEIDAPELTFYGHPDVGPGSLDTFSGEPSGRRSAVPAVVAPLARPGTADVFESLFAAEQGDSTEAVAALLRAARPVVTDEMLETIASRVVEKLAPAALGDDLRRALGADLRESLAALVHDAVATETRAAVAEAVQAAVDSSILGTLRGAVNEAVEHHLGGRMESAVRESADRVLSGSVEHAVRESVSAQVGPVVREAVEREVREAMGPTLQRTLRDLVGATVRQAVTDVMTAGLPAALAEAVHGEVGVHVREVVRETSERLVRDEIARIRARQTS